ncbi:MAG: transposase [Gammaproteobacteria bacterium]|nr:transposase [Gammaproteobacteria bacterium]
MSEYRRVYTGGASYFFTVVTHKRRRFLAQPNHIMIGRSVVRDVKQRYPFAIDACVILPDHIHFIWTMPDGDVNYSRRIGLIKAACSRAFIACGLDMPAVNFSRKSRNEHAVWQRRFWEHRIRDERDYRHCMDYLHYNPVKHGLVCSVNEWPYSSFHRWVKAGVYSMDWGANVDIESEGFGE